jgi:hypothetical protein
MTDRYQPTPDELRVIEWLRRVSHVKVNCANMNLPAISPTIERHDARVLVEFANRIEQGHHRHERV